MAQSTPLSVGLDVHKDSIAVAHAQGQSADPPVSLGAIGTRGDTLFRDLTGQGFASAFWTAISVPRGLSQPIPPR